MRLHLDCFYGGEAEQFTFYRIPKVLFTDHHYRAVSVEAKVLYGLMLDRITHHEGEAELLCCQKKQLRMLRNFAAAIQKREPLIAPGSDGVNTLTLVNGAYLSAWEGRRLTLPIDGKRYLEELSLREKREAAL